MENYVVSARKYRPSTFKSVVGQQALTHTLKAAIDSKRLAHAYLFCGPRGVGKTSCARIFAKTINCLSPTEDGDACNQCESCVAFNEQRSYNIVELDAASNNSVDDIRNLVDQVRIPPQIGKYRVYIIDEVHMLSTQAFNAFLKTLEEPPEHAIFILATTEKHKILPTILSRCQIYDFARITPQDIVEQLQYISSQEHITAEPSALNVIAQKADGAMRDALSIFDQVAASSMGNITYRSTIENLNVLDYEYYFRLVDAFIEGDVPKALLTYKEIREHGFDSLFFINGLASHIRDLMVASTPATLPLLEVGKEIISQYGEQAAKCSKSFFYQAMNLCNDCDLNYRIASNKQFLVELTLIKLCQLTDNPTPTTPNNPPLKKVAPASAPASQPTPQQSAPSNSATNAPASASAPQPVAEKKHIADKPSPVANHVPAPPPLRKEKGIGSPLLNKRISISDISIDDVESGSAVSDSDGDCEEMNKKVSLTAWENAWSEFIKGNPKEVVLINAMQVCPNTKSSDLLTHVMDVDNQGQLDIVNNALPALNEYLRKTLNNSNIVVTAKLNQNLERTKVLTPREIAAEMMEKYEPVKELVKTFDLRISM